ncbi:MAG: cation transporter [Gammaproteobacteria bacterium]|nr:cation transporter [Gammaproteobacteria bacterium]
MSGCGCGNIEITNKEQKNVLVVLLAINAFMFVFEVSVGWYAQSTGLIADSFDMFADAVVYGIAIYAIGKSIQEKSRAALLSGWFQCALAIFIITDVARRVFVGSEPVSVLMLVVGIIALIANISCLVLINKHKDGEVHMRASWIFSKNDVIANIGVIFGGVLVWLFGSRWPDLIVGSLIALIILNGARCIIIEANKELDNSKYM